MDRQAANCATRRGAVAQERVTSTQLVRLLKRLLPRTKVICGLTPDETVPTRATELEIREMIEMAADQNVREFQESIQSKLSRELYPDCDRWIRHCIPMHANLTIPTRNLVDALRRAGLWGLGL